LAKVLGGKVGVQILESIAGLMENTIYSIEVKLLFENKKIIFFFRKLK